MLVVAAGCLLVLAAFLPWTSYVADYVDGRHGVQTFSGWDLMRRCTVRSAPGLCVFEDHSAEGEIAPHHVLAGDWALVTGAALAAIGVALAWSRPGTRACGALIGAAWVAALAALACAGATVVLFLGVPKNPGGAPTIKDGVAVAAVAPVLAVIGLVVAQSARARARARARTSLRDLSRTAP